jgi:hypothetical protein
MTYTCRRPTGSLPKLESLEDRCLLSFAPGTFLKTPFPSHETPLEEHFHPHLHILIDGTEHVIPGDTNIVGPDDPIIAQGVAPGLYPIHTHMEDLQMDPPDTGKLHVESTLPYDFRLGDFFTLWTYTSGSPKIFNSHEIKIVDSDGQQIDFLADATHTITMTVDDQPNGDFENFILRDPQSSLPENPGPTIVITGTTLSPPASSPTPTPQGNANQMLVSQYYQDCLGREPDPQGMEHFTGLLDQGTANRAEVALMIQTSAEARAWQVQTLFHRFLGRQADPVGLDLSTRFLGMGGSLVKLECVIGSSPEYFSHNGNTNNLFLTAVYRDALGRQVDPVGQSLGGQALSDGMDRDKLAEVVFASTEGVQNLVQGFYGELLHRQADSVGLNSACVALSQHLQQLGMPPGEQPSARSSAKVGSSEDDVLETIMSSDEYVGRLQTRAGQHAG